MAIAGSLWAAVVMGKLFLRSINGGQIDWAIQFCLSLSRWHPVWCNGSRPRARFKIGGL